MSKHYKATHILKLIEAEAERTSGAAVGRRLGFTRSYIADLLWGRRPITESIAMAYGFDRHEKPAEVWFTKQETY